MNRNPDEPAFGAWLRDHAPRSAPAGLLERGMGVVDQTPRRREGWWSVVSRSVIIGPAIAGVAIVALAVVLVLGNLPGPTLPVAEGSASPSAVATGAATGSPDGSAQPATFSPSATAIETNTPEPTSTPTAAPTAEPTPVPTPIETPPPLGDPGTFTFRVTFNEMPSDVARVVILLEDADRADRAGHTPHAEPAPISPSVGSGFALCGGDMNPAACTARMTYEQTFSVTLPEVRWSYTVAVEQTSGSQIISADGPGYRRRVGDRRQVPGAGHSRAGSLRNLQWMGGRGPSLGRPVRREPSD